MLLNSIRLNIILSALVSALCYILTTPSAMAEIVSLNASTLAASAYNVDILPPCNWTVDTSNIYGTAFYGHHGTRRDEMTLVQVFPVAATATTLEHTMLNLVFDPAIAMKESLPLHHLEVELDTTKKPCTSGFGFKGGGFVK